MKRVNLVKFIISGVPLNSLSTPNTSTRCHSSLQLPPTYIHASHGDLCLSKRPRAPIDCAAECSRKDAGHARMFSSIHDEIITQRNKPLISEYRATEASAFTALFLIDCAIIRETLVPSHRHEPL